MITLVAVLCHHLAGMPHPVCVDEVVPTDFAMMAGKVNDPVQVPFTWGYCEIHGQELVADWMNHNPKYRNWRLAAWKCVPGQYEPSGHA
jgi:hypothetical protein